MSLPDLTIRPYRPGDEERILETFNLVFREVCGPGYTDRTLEQWRWQYLQNPWGHRMSLAVAPDGTVVSQYAGVPVRADTPYGQQTFVHCVDSMTHPAWRAGLKRPGIFVITGLPFSAHSRRIGDAVLYGFPVDAAFRIGSRYLEYHFLRVIDFLIRDVGLPVLDPPAGLVVERTTVIPPDIGSLYAVVRAEKRVLLRRDHQYLDWRYVQNPARADYELWTAREAGSRRLRGFLVLKPGSGLAPDAATIADWLAGERDAAAAQALLHVATARAAEQGRLRLMVVCPEWSAEWRAFEAAGFVRTPSAHWLERRLVYLLTGSPLTEAGLAQDWWYMLGDSDLA
ncbi:MAG: hypothetical protein JNK49_20770 [Planctomycetes bacterium]|nr:hypothetical protein [Planctomycetota bacterium]